MDGQASIASGVAFALFGSKAVRFSSHLVLFVRLIQWIGTDNDGFIADSEDVN